VHGVNALGVKQDTLCKCCFARINVCAYANVAHAGQFPFHALFAPENAFRENLLCAACLHIKKFPENKFLPALKGQQSCPNCQNRI
jgi:hypothetical protein